MCCFDVGLFTLVNRGTQKETLFGVAYFGTSHTHILLARVPGVTILTPAASRQP